MDTTVNKRFLSTGETGEFVSENVGFGLNPGVELAPPRSLLSNWRERRTCKILPNVADTGNSRGRRCCQDNGPGNLVCGQYGSPQNPVSNDLSGAQVIEYKRRMDGDERGGVQAQLTTIPVDRLLGYGLLPSAPKTINSRKGGELRDIKAEKTSKSLDGCRSLSHTSRALRRFAPI